MSQNGHLVPEQAQSPKGCGAGTKDACFSLTVGEEGFECSLVTDQEVANLAGIQLGWRVNVDPSDEKAWCPLGVLDNSKVG